MTSLKSLLPVDRTKLSLVNLSGEMRDFEIPQKSCRKYESAFIYFVGVLDVLVHLNVDCVLELKCVFVFGA